MSIDPLKPTKTTQPNEKTQLDSQRLVRVVHSKSLGRSRNDGILNGEKKFAIVVSVFFAITLLASVLYYIA